MKIRQPWLIRVVGFLGAQVLRLWSSTLRFQYRPLGSDVDPHRPDLKCRYIYAMWHEYLLLPISIYNCPDVHVLISRHGDGQLLTEICGHLGIPVVRGSTTRGAVQAVREMLQKGVQTHLSLTPDGPKGPRQKIQPGLIFLASRTGLPIVPVGFGLHQPRRLKTWDRFALPRPFCRARCVTAEPIMVPADADADLLEQYRQHVELAMTRATDLAEQWAESGEWPAEQADACGLDKATKPAKLTLHSDPDFQAIAS